ncbi:MAG: hypothetical protein ACE361_07580 [Aureliella sp.]
MRLARCGDNGVVWVYRRRKKHSPAYGSSEVLLCFRGGGQSQWRGSAKTKVGIVRVALSGVALFEIAKVETGDLRLVARRYLFKVTA